MKSIIVAVLVGLGWADALSAAERGIARHELGTPPGTQYSVPTAINNKGVRTGDLLADRFRMIECTWTLPYDPTVLQTEKVFLSLIDVTLEESAEG